MKPIRKAAYLVLNHLSIVGDINKAVDCALLTAHEILDIKTEPGHLDYYNQVIEEIKKHVKDK